MKKIIYLSCFLGLVCAVAGGALTIVNNATAPIIEAMALESEKANLELIYPGANFSEVENTDETGLIKGIYQAEGLGYIYKVENYGYASTPFTFLIAFNNDGTVAGYQVLSSSETSGVGSRCFEEDYSNQVKALTSADAFPLLSGATLTSTGVTNGIDAAKAHFNNLQGIEYDPNAKAEAPALATGNPVSLSDDLSSFDAKIDNETADGNLVTYTIRVKGYGLIDPEGHAGESGHEYARNYYDVTVDKDTMSITSVKMTSFGDTEGIGDKVNNEEYLALFEGATLDSEIDTVTGATWTSKSVHAACKAALEAANQ